TIEYAFDLLDELRRLAVDSFHALSHGGLETGGVLYGIRDEQRTTLIAFAELACEHSSGPSFTLSVRDRITLATLMQPPPGFETVGLFRIHTRGRVEMDTLDREIFDQYFTAAGCIAFLLKPTHWGPADASFFVRDSYGAILPSGPEFTLEISRSGPAESA